MKKNWGWSVFGKHLNKIGTIYYVDLETHPWKILKYTFLYFFVSEKKSKKEKFLLEKNRQRRSDIQDASFSREVNNISFL